MQELLLNRGPITPYLNFVNSYVVGTVPYLTTIANQVVGLLGTPGVDSCAMRKFAVDEPRIEPLGLRCYPMTLNDVTMNEGLDLVGSWPRTNVTANANIIAGPDGDADGDQIVETVAVGLHNIQQAVPYAIPNSYVVQVWGVPITARNLLLELDSSSTAGPRWAIFDLVNATVLSQSAVAVTPSIQQYDTGKWNLCALQFDTLPGETIIGGAFIRLGLCQGVATNYLGDGSSNIILWGPNFGPQKNLGPYLNTGPVALTANPPQYEIASAGTAWEYYLQRQALQIETTFSLPYLPTNTIDLVSATWNPANYFQLYIADDSNMGFKLMTNANGAPSSHTVVSTTSWEYNVQYKFRMRCGVAKLALGEWSINMWKVETGELVYNRGLSGFRPDWNFANPTLHLLGCPFAPTPGDLHMVDIGL